MKNRVLYGGIEAGGTKFVCAVGTGPQDLQAVERFSTTTPDETLAQAVAFFRAQPEPVVALGVGAFGPVDLHPASPTYGFITTTPKPGWAQTDLAGALRRALGVPVAFDTDVNVAGWGEYRWGAAQGLGTFLYLTIGTGVGGGAIVNGTRLHGLLHPEMGHLLVSRAEGDTFAGICPYHGACLEGMAAGPALRARWGVSGDTLPPDHPAWRFQAHYLAQALVQYILTLSPQKIILGGGVMQQAHLFPMVRQQVQALLNGYVQHPMLLDRPDHYIIPPALGDKAGVLGALALAQEAAPGG